MAKILIIDDEKGVCEEFSGLLRDESHQVDTALSGREGIEKAQGQSYDVIFLDVLMPKMEGREALAEIKKVSKSPVVIMSGYLPTHKEKEIIQAGAFASLKKPLDLKQVYSLIQKALDSKPK
ncbi:MAG: response regulator [Candidatus Omnitrophica bacterium]|nr:response regulator [Candidatus Omnitrophota bacterium]